MFDKHEKDPRKNRVLPCGKQGASIMGKVSVQRNLINPYFDFLSVREMHVDDAALQCLHSAFLAEASSLYPVIKLLNFVRALISILGTNNCKDS